MTQANKINTVLYHIWVLKLLVSPTISTVRCSVSGLQNDLRGFNPGWRSIRVGLNFALANRSLLKG